MKKILIIVLIIFGGAAGYWLARQNQKLFELPHTRDQLRNGKEEIQNSPFAVEIGMDFWQVKEILGPPQNRVVVSEQPGAIQEIWIYKNRRLRFENGSLTRLEEL